MISNDQYIGIKEGNKKLFTELCLSLDKFSHNLTTFYYTTTWFKKSKYTVNTTHYSPTAQKHCKGATLDSTNTLLAIYLGWQD